MRENKGFTYLEVLASLVSLAIFLSFMGSTMYLAYQNHLKAKDLYERSCYSEEVLAATKGLIEEENILQQLENEESKKEIIKNFQDKYQTQKFQCEVDIQRFEAVGEEENTKIVKQKDLQWIEDKATLQLQTSDFKESKQDRLLVIYLEDFKQRRELKIIDQEESLLMIKVVRPLTLLEESLEEKEKKMDTYFSYSLSKERGSAFIEHTDFFYEPNNYRITVYIKDHKEVILEEIKDIYSVEKI